MGRIFWVWGWRSPRVQSAQVPVSSGMRKTLPAGAPFNSNGLSAGFSATARPVCTAANTCFGVKWKSCCVSTNCWCNLLILSLSCRSALTYFLAFWVLASASRVSNCFLLPSIKPDICGAITGLTLPISSRIASSFLSARIMSSLWPPTAWPSPSPASTGCQINTSLAFWPKRSIRPLRCSITLGL